MPRQRMDHKWAAKSFPEDFPLCLERFKDTSGLTWKDMAQRLGTSPLSLRRWRGGMRPSSSARSISARRWRELGLAHLLPTWRARREQDGRASSTWDGLQLRLLP